MPNHTIHLELQQHAYVQYNVNIFFNLQFYFFFAEYMSLIELGRIIFRSL